MVIYGKMLLLSKLRRFIDLDGQLAEMLLLPLFLLISPKKKITFQTTNVKG